MPADVAKELRMHVLLNVICFGGGVLFGVGVTHAASAVPPWLGWVAAGLVALAALALALTIASAWRVIRLMNARYREEDERRREGRG